METVPNKKTNKLKWLVILLLGFIILEGLLIYRLTKPENNFSLSPYIFLDDQWNDGFFSAKGSWISDTKLAFPVESVELTCYSEFKYCIIADAYIMDNYLAVGTSLYTIERWTSEEITTKAEPSAAGCVANKLQIDRQTKRVTFSRITLDNKTGLCEGITEKPIVSYLGDGLKRIEMIKSQRE